MAVYCMHAAAQRVPAEAFAGSRVLLACAHAGRGRLPTCRRWVAASTWKGGYVTNHSKSFSSSIFSLEGELLGWISCAPLTGLQLLLHKHSMHALVCL